MAKKQWYIGTDVAGIRAAPKTEPGEGKAVATVQTKLSLAADFRSPQYLVSANGRFEWQRIERGKQPYFLALEVVPQVLRGFSRASSC